MAIRHLRFMPIAHSLVLVCLAASRRAAAVYRIEDADPKISSEDADIKVMAGGTRTCSSELAKSSLPNSPAR
jgi:hypothetical protein